MMRVSGASCLALIASAQMVAACSFFFDERSADEIRAQSAPVSMDRQCRMINGGVRDNVTLGRAEHLGDGRFQQVVGDYSQSLVYVADCNTREATLLRGTPTEERLTSCGPDYGYADLAGPNAMMSLSEGADLHELVDIASARGVIELNPLKHFFEFKINIGEEPHDVGTKDRFDLMCGCKSFYPDSLGAQ